MAELNPYKVIRASMNRKEKADVKVRQLMDCIVWLLLETSYTSIDTKTFLKGTVRGGVGTVKDTLEEKGIIKNENSIHQAIHRDRIKLERDFGTQCIKDLFMYRSNAKLESYTEKVLAVMVRYRDTGLISGIGLDLKKGSGNINMNISDDDFNDLVEKIRPYTMTIMQSTAEKITIRQIGYLNYLNSFDSLSDTDIDRKKLLTELIGK